MNGTRTRARTGRTTGATGATGDQRRDARTRSYVDGANALQVGYADDIDEREYVDPAELAPPTIQPRRRPRSRPEAQTVDAPVTPPLPIALPRAPFLVLMVSLVVLGVAGVLILNTKINENAFRLDSLQGQQTSLDLQEQQLKQNLAQLEAPGNLRAAASRLGLVPAGTPAFINLPDGRVVGVPQPATGSTTTSGR
jgi:hypothetical protein